GYGTESAEKRQQIFRQRVMQLETLGAEGYAAERAPFLLRPDAGEREVAQVAYSMGLLQQEGFSRCSWMLAHDDIHRYLPDVKVNTQIWCGEVDTITPPQGAQSLAQRYGWPFHLLLQAGHASYLDAAGQFNRQLVQFCQGNSA
ncbi:MAG: alpha/beta fold hydrolase, partial [Enterobacteriaceae bacterium]